MSKKSKTIKKKKRSINGDSLTYISLLTPGIVFLIIFSIIPLFGLIIAFQDYIPAKGVWGSSFVGLENFEFMFLIPDSYKIFFNTLIIAVSKIIAGIIVPVIFALLLNEVKHKFTKKTIQTIVIMPNFLSWVILGNIFLSMFALDGVVNQLVVALGMDPIMFMASNTWYRPIIIATDTWKGFGYGAIIYLSALTSIDPALYEAAAIDGASKWKQLIKITLPMLVPMIILMTTLSLGNVLNAGFDQIFNTYNPLVYDTGDIIDTYVYRMGLIDMQYSLSTAVGLMKSVISFILMIISYGLAKKFSGYRIF